MYQMPRFFKRRCKAAASLFLAFLMVVGLVACNKNESPAPTPQPESTPAPAEPEPEPEPSFDPTTSAYLTGLEKSAGYPEGQRVAAVMVGNDRGAWPHDGLSEAKVLVEAIVDSWYITRLVAVFEDYKTMPDVRPVRSARDQLYQMVAPMYPLFIHDGPGSTQAQVYLKMRQIDAEEFDFRPSSFKGGVSATARTSRYSIPYNEYTNGELLSNAVEKSGVDDVRQYNSPIFDFVPYTEEKRFPEEGSATDVMITHNASNRTGLTWNGEQYEISMSDRGSMVALTDGNNGETIAFDNALVIFVPMNIYANDILVEVHYGAGGVGYYFSQGCWEPFYWEKNGVGGMLTLKNLYNMDESFQINPGTTYIAVVNDSQAEDFDAQLRFGTVDNSEIPDVVGSVD